MSLWLTSPYGTRKLALRSKLDDQRVHFVSILLGITVLCGLLSNIYFVHSLVFLFFQGGKVDSVPIFNVMLQTEQKTKNHTPTPSNA